MVSGLLVLKVSQPLFVLSNHTFIGCRMVIGYRMTRVLSIEQQTKNNQKEAGIGPHFNNFFSETDVVRRQT